MLVKTALETFILFFKTKIGGGFMGSRNTNILIYPFRHTYFIHVIGPSSFFLTHTLQTCNSILFSLLNDYSK